MKCKNCNEKDAIKYSKYSSGEFCSRKCACGFSTKAKRKEINEKVSKTLSGQKKTAIHKKRISESLLVSDKYKAFVQTRKGTNAFFTDSWRENISISMKKYYKSKIWTDEERDRLSRQAKEQNFGGHTSKKAVYYKMKNGSVVYLHSSYEEKVAMSLDENNVNWIRPEPLRYIGKDDKEHRYYADFYLKDYNIYLDTKNDYLIQKDKDKIKRVREQNQKIIMVLDKDHLEWSLFAEMVCSRFTNKKD